MVNSGGEYQVFLNFCGPDTRRGFTNSLYYNLVDAGIRVFIDNKELPRGEKFSSNLPQAIDNSQLYITILSPNYALHHWCLRELAKMVENISKPEEDGNKKVILPIFYKVTPNDVKSKTGLYSKSISKLEQKMEDQKKKFRTEEVERWRQALEEVDAIQGWELEQCEGDGHLSKLVVEEVVNRLRTRQKEVTENLVGMEYQRADINKLLKIKPGVVRLIGICGMGGVGKTTLAKIIYNQLCPSFGKNCSFLDDVRETAKTKGLVELQKQLLSDFSNSRVASNICTIDHGIKRIGDTICRRKVLIVLDDVDEGNQIQNLVGVNSLCPGTVILVTTRNESILEIKNFKYEIKPFKMRELEHKDALELFSRHAFNDKSPPDDYYNLSDELVSFVGGLPLAIKAIGASLFDQEDKHKWKKMLKKLWKLHDEHPDDVLGKLEITYDALTPAQRNIFLDIACLFINEENTNPGFVGADFMFGPNSAIDGLIKRCMIKVLDNNKYWMHDQFRDLGRAIAEKGHTRLWDTSDIIRKLHSREEKRSVQALCFRRQRYDPCITVTANAIERFPRLRFLWLANVNLQGNFAGCLSGLKWFYLCGNTIVGADDPPFMPTNLHLRSVVVLKTWCYEWTEDALNSLLKNATQLKILIIHVSYSIHGIITFSKYSVLEKLELFHCPSLKISCSIEELRQLTYLELKACHALQNLPKQIGKLKYLQHLSLTDCVNLRELPHSVSKLESLTKLVALKSSITRLPRTMSKLTKLHTLDLSHSNKIQELPELPRSLTTLRLTSHSLRIVPDVSSLTNLVELLLSDCSISNCDDWIPHSNIIRPCNLPWSGGLSNLRKQELCLLNVRATSIEWGSFSLLEELCLSGLDLQTLKQLPSNLRVLQLHSTRVEQVELGELPKLEELIIKSCEPIARISITSSLNKLRYVEVRSCKSMEMVFDASISKIPKKCQIKIRRCGKLLDAGSHDSSITWKCYRKMILNAQTQASDSTIETTFSETGQSSRGLLPDCSMGDNDENNEVYEEGKGDSDSDEDKMRTRKSKRGTMQKMKRKS